MHCSVFKNLVLSFAFNSNFSSSEEVSADCSDPTRFRLIHETSFVCFFRQFFRSVQKADYLTMRHGFISVSFSSPLILRASAILNLLSNVHGRKAQFFVSFLPLVVSLAVGTKPQAVIATMAIEIKEKHACGARDTTCASDLMYTLNQHETLNASFLVRNFQLGSTMKRSIFDQQTSKALKNWHKKAVKKTNEGKPCQLQTKTLGGSPDASSVHSPSLTPPRPKKFGTEDPDFTNVEADKMATVDLDAKNQRRPSDSSFQFGYRDLPS
ncbi:hypothetical protein POTOM_022225 [Populus tomentosa]|uniref:Uncharacterized protein n=1 Tax=Populus tomentosa TaxID=118781 RepID=A0A8X7ZP86_POPTO|nr:hypothetical protein POTOM_022225 [Populus tomentosa]